jgi:cobalamin biosynthesis Co2+ chelatase CbiK
MFKPGSEADLKVVGGPNSNNYGGFLTLHMESDSMDCVRAKTYDYKNMVLTEGEEIEIPVAEGNVFAEIPVLPALLGDTVTIEFRSKNNGKWYKRDFTLSLEKKEGAFDPYAGDVVVQEIAKLESVEKAKEYAKANATPKLTDLLIEAIQVQVRDENTDKLCAAAKTSWDTLTADEKKEVGEADYFGLDTGDAEKDDPLSTDPDKEKELLVVSFGTSFNDSRVATISAVEKALAKAYPEYAVRRAFTAQIIINHIAARDGEQIDNVAQAMDKAVAAGVKEMIVQPTHLMSGAEYDELKGEIDKYADKIDIKYAKPLLDSDADKELVAKEVVAAAAKDAGYADTEAAIADKDTAFVFMGHGTAHEAKATYTYMQQTMDKLGFANCFVGTVEGEPEETEVHEILKKVQAGGFKKVVLRPLMVVAGDHANNDMAGDEDDSWKSIFGAALGAENVTCQIKGLGEIEAVQQLYVDHTGELVKEEPEPIGKLKKNTIKASGKTVKVKASRKKTTFKKSKAFSVRKAVGKVTFKKKSGSKKVTVSKAGKVTVKKGLKKGKTYKIKVKVTAAGNNMYKSKTVTVTLKVKVTK